MSNTEIPQSEAARLLKIPKYFLGQEPVLLAQKGEKQSLEFSSQDKREFFKIDFSRGRIKLSQATYQNRTREIIILARLDIDGPPHTNPDGTFVPCPHLHIYREGYNDKWATPAPPGQFTNMTDLLKTLDEFFDFCSVSKKPILQLTIE